MISRSGVPIVNSPTPACLTQPLTVQSSVPGDVVGADLAEPVGAFGERDRDVRERLDVVDQRGRRFGLGVGRRPSRRAPTDPESDVSSSGVSTISSTPRRYGGAMRGNG